MGGWVAGWGAGGLGGGRGGWGGGGGGGGGAGGAGGGGRVGGGRKATAPFPYLADQLTLFQPGEGRLSPHNTTGTFRHH